MKSDLEIQKDVMDQLKSEPFLNSSKIGVAVNEGIVTLSGQVDMYSKKSHAEKATKKVSGVKAIAENIQVGISSAAHRTDTDIAEAVLSALKWNTMVPDENITVKVEGGIVKLEGELDWEYQRNQAKSSVENLMGVRAVVNGIVIKPKVSASDIVERIRSSFQRIASIDANKITAEVSGSRVILYGKSRSFTEREDAENTAWCVPGVTNVDNRIVVEEPEFAF
jgi:osmotically-inducible protein OsmY